MWTTLFAFLGLLTFLRWLYTLFETELSLIPDLTVGLLSRSGAGPTKVRAENETEREIASLIENELPLPAEAKLPPARILRDRWHLPSPVAKEVGVLVDLLMRDFVCDWYLLKDQTHGISNNTEFLEFLQYQITNLIGNLGYRAAHVNPLLFVIDDVMEALRAHLAMYSEMRHRAAIAKPSLFTTFTEEELLVQAKERVSKEMRDATAPAPSPSISNDELLQSELRWIEEQQERAILAECGKANALHAACDLTKSRVLEAKPSKTSSCNALNVTISAPPAELLTEYSYLRTIANQLIARMLPKQEKNSKLLTLLFREILTTSLLQPLLSNGEPDTLNWYLIRWIQLLFDGAGEVAGVENGSSSVAPPAAPTEST